MPIRCVSASNIWIYRSAPAICSGWTRLPLPVLSQQATANHFVAQFDSGTELSLRTLFVQAAAETAAKPENVSAKALMLSRPVTY